MNDPLSISFDILSTDKKRTLPISKHYKKIIMMQGYLKALILLVCAFWCSFNADARTRKLTSTNSFSVGSYGARADGRTDDSQAFMNAWKAACASSGDVTIVIPQGIYELGPVKFTGPCKNVHTITVNLQGTLKASTDLNKYDSADDWVEFKFINGLRLTGGGTLDGQGSSAWGRAQCSKNKNCKVLPVSIKFDACTNTIVSGITSRDPKFFHFAVYECRNFQGLNLNIKAPANSPNTDGMHIEKSTTVVLNNIRISSGDDCISIGQGNYDVVLSGITCTAGHGISVGSLGRYQGEWDVKGLIVKDSTLSNTMNGVRVKTWENSPSWSVAENMTFQNIQMNNVYNPIIIDQNYCPYASCDHSAPSKVKLSNVWFKDIRGSSASQVAVTLKCSKNVPCQNVQLQNVNLKYVGGSQPTALCANANVNFAGIKLPAACVWAS